MTLIMIGLYKR